MKFHVQPTLEYCYQAQNQWHQSQLSLVCPHSLRLKHFRTVEISIKFEYILYNIRPELIKMLNYKQLYYFWNVAKHGGITRAAEQLHLTPQTISGQLSELEHASEIKLFNRVGKRLELTSHGKLAYSYADEIFQVGKELEALLREKTDLNEISFKVGISDVVPKTIAYKLLSPTLRMQQSIKLHCQEAGLESLFAALALHQLDLVIADKPLSSEFGVKAYNHQLGSSTLAFYATPDLKQILTKPFPECLEQAPLLLPGSDSALRLKLERWLSQNELYPQIAGEFDDSALMKAFGQEGAGLFPAPSVIAEELFKQHGVEIITEVPEITLDYYAISAERKLKHPAVVTISDAAHLEIFHSG